MQPRPRLTGWTPLGAAVRIADTSGPTNRGTPSWIPSAHTLVKEKAKVKQATSASVTVTARRVNTCSASSAARPVPGRCVTGIWSPTSSNCVDRGLHGHERDRQCCAGRDTIKHSAHPRARLGCRWPMSLTWESVALISGLEIGVGARGVPECF